MPPKPTQPRFWNRQRILIGAQVFAIVLLLGVLIVPGAMSAISEEPRGLVAAPTAAELRPTTKPNPFTDLELTARAVFVWDIHAHRRLYGKNEYVRMPLASVTKMMTALTAKETIPSDAVIAISAKDLMSEGDSGLRVGERWNVSDLLALALISSSNDAASAIARAGGEFIITEAGRGTDPNEAFIAKMNEKAHSIGLLDTIFRNETGLDLSPETTGGEGTARDMAMLYEYIWRKHPEIFRVTAQPGITLVSESGFIHQVKNTNDAVARIPGIIGSKTGYTDLAGGNLVIITDIGIDHPIVIAVLGSTRDGRFADVEALRLAAISAITGMTE
jgi:D-alanyl-D-alanine carboxypeptidase (penicillin-binding protein 5/6)